MLKFLCDGQGDIRQAILHADRSCLVCNDCKKKMTDMKITWFSIYHVSFNSATGKSGNRDK